MARGEHNKAAEHHENAAKAHRSAAEHHGKGDHAKGKEHAASAKQHSQTAHQHSTSERLRDSASVVSPIGFTTVTAHSVLSSDVNSYEEMVERATQTALAEEFAQRTDSIVVVAGVPFGEAGTTNNLRVVQIG